MSNDVRPDQSRMWKRHAWPEQAGRQRPVWTAEAPDEELSIREHAEAIALVEELRPYCTRWSVELLRPDIAREIGLITGGPDANAMWAIYRDSSRTLHFEDLVAGTSYTFGTMSAGLRFVRAVLEAAAATEEEFAAAGRWWERLPGWLVTDDSLQAGG